MVHISFRLVQTRCSTRTDPTSSSSALTRCLFKDVEERSFVQQQDSIANVLRGGAGRKWFIKSDVRPISSSSFPDPPLTSFFSLLVSFSFSTLLATTSFTRRFGCSEISQTAAVRSFFSSLSRRARPFSDSLPTTRFPHSLALRTRRRSSS